VNVRTRFAPSPTGYLHIGGARTALFSWAYARRHGGKFVLRIEDTDVERSTETSVQAILDGMRWLGLDWDEGPFFQMKRLARYREVAEQLIAAGHAYYDYMPREELDLLRKRQTEKGEKPRYDRAIGQKYRGQGPAPVRFKTPQEGSVGWSDLVKGPIEFPNAELDDLVLLRADGVPTYNFGVVVDDLDMQITHVIRGDDHVNNTPRQIHIFNALKKPLPQFAHLPMILGQDGERLSKRHGAVSVTEYRDQGFLPDAMVNYLSRLGWAHGNDEIFSREQLVEWFDLKDVAGSPARFDVEKLKWINQQYMKAQPPAANSAMASLIDPKFKELLERKGHKVYSAFELYTPRGHTLSSVATAVLHLVEPPKVSPDQVPSEVHPALVTLRKRLAAMPQWDRKSVGVVLKEVAVEHGLKMAQLAMPTRVLVTGVTEAPSVDALLEAVLELLGRDTVLERLSQHIQEG
jgi:glutamyl-tRNA synthetase